MSETTVKENSLDDVINAQKQLDEELQQLKNRYSRYNQLVSFQKEEEDYLLKNKEHVNPKRISLSLRRKKDVTYGLMPHDDDDDDIIESFKKEESVKEGKKSFEDMSKTANSFINAIRKKTHLKSKKFELPPSPPKEQIDVKEEEEEKPKEEKEEKVEKIEEEKEKEEVKDGEHQEKEMNRLCDLVQSLLSEAQDAIDTKPELSHPDIGKEEEEPEISIPKRLQSLNTRHSSRILDGLNETSSVSSNKHLSIMTDTTAIAQPLSPINKTCGEGFDEFDDFSMTSKSFDCLNSPYNAKATTPNDEYMKGNMTISEGMNYYPPQKFYPPPEFFYGPPPAGYPPYFDPAYGPIPPYAWEEFQKQRMGLSGEGSSSAEASIGLKSHKEDQEIIKHTTTTTTTTTTEVKKDKKRVVEGKALVKKRHHRKHHKHIKPIDADGNICDTASSSNEKSLVKKKESSKLFKAQFGSDTQLFLSFFASFFVTSILVTISCLWSVIQVMAGNVNDKNLTRLLMSSSENAIRNNKKKIQLILDKDSDSESEDDSSSEDSNDSKLLTDESSDSQDKYTTAPSVSDDEEEEESEEDEEDDVDEFIKIPSKFKGDLNTINSNVYSTSLKTLSPSVNTHRRCNSL